MSDYQQFDPYQKSDYKNLRLHPFKIYLTLLLAGVTMLFLGMTASYVYQRVVMSIEPIALPLTFALNTGFLLASSWTFLQAKKSYLADNTDAYKRFLFLTLMLTVCFIVGQGWAWLDMSSKNLIPSTGPAVGYIYAIAILHLIHVFAGLPFFIMFLHTAFKRMKEPVSVLIYFSDPEKKLKLRLLEVYWHYLDALWLILVLFFTFNYLIQF
ncbi:MAG: cytochrome c oxidase subunit 3 [Saprospiraceae bacterium]|jgi:cytochrome c oxidase subunit 3